MALSLTFAPGFPVGPLAPRPPRGPYRYGIQKQYRYLEGKTEGFVFVGSI